MHPCWIKVLIYLKKYVILKDFEKNIFLPTNIIVLFETSLPLRSVSLYLPTSDVFTLRIWMDSLFTLSRLI